MTMIKLTKSTILDTALYNLKQAAERLHIETPLAEKLSQPKEVIKITANPSLPSGRRINFQAFIVRHNDAMGPAKGGIG